MCFAVSSMKLFLNSCSLKHLINIKNKGWQQNINYYVNTCDLMLMMLNVWKSFTKPLSKIKCKTNIFWKIIYSVIYLKYFEQTLVNLVTVKAHDYSKPVWF